MRIKSFISVLAVAAMCTAPVLGSIPVELDFYTTPWLFGPPYVRDAGRDTLGVSSLDPYLFDGTSDAAWEETTYFTFDFQPGDFGGPVDSAVLRVETVVRGFSTYPNETEPFAISAHRVLDDPTTIDGSLSSGAGSFVEFKNTQIGGVEDTVSLTEPGIYDWDITDLVNEWIANGDANFDYSIAMTGRVGNPVDTEDIGAFHSFINSEGGLEGLAAQIIVPEPATAVLAAMGTFAFMRRRVRG